MSGTNSEGLTWAGWGTFTGSRTTAGATDR